MTLRKLATSLLLAALALGGGASLIDRRAAAREAAAEASYPPTGQLLTVDGRTVHAHVSGMGPDLVLIHGASGNTRDFTFNLVERLADRYRVIALDRPGMGWSDNAGDAGVSPLVQADILRAAADQLGISRPIVLGHSYGGSVAMAWGLRAPGETAALVIVGGATMPWPGGLDAWYRITASRLGRAAFVPLVSALASPERASQAITSIFAPDPVPPGYPDYIGAGLTLRRDSFATNARQVNGLRPHIVLMADAYPTLDLPVEIVHGTADAIVPHDVHAVPLSKALPDAQLTLLPGVGHMPHHADPDAVVAAIDRAAERAGLR